MHGPYLPPGKAQRKALLKCVEECIGSRKAVMITYFELQYLSSHIARKVSGYPQHTVILSIATTHKGVEFHFSGNFEMAKDLTVIESLLKRLRLSPD